MAWALDSIGVVAWCQRDLIAAEIFIREAFAIYTELERRTSMGMCLADLTAVLISKGDVQRAIDAAQQAVAITRAVEGYNMLTVSLCYLGAAFIAAGDPVEARGTLLEAVRRAWQYEYIHFVMIAFYYFAELLVLESQGQEPGAALKQRSHAVELLTCVRTQIQAWQIFRDKATADLRTHAAPCAAQPETIVEPLTVCELTVLYLIAAGRTNQDIANELVIMQGTAKWYVSQILGKLGVQSRTQAVTRGRELGLLA